MELQSYYFWCHPSGLRLGQENGDELKHDWKDTTFSMKYVRVCKLERRKSYRTTWKSERKEKVVVQRNRFKLHSDGMD